MLYLLMPEVFCLACGFAHTPDIMEECAANAEKRARKNTRTAAKAASRENSPEDSLYIYTYMYIPYYTQTQLGGGSDHYNGPAPAGLRLTMAPKSMPDFSIKP